MSETPTTTKMTQAQWDTLTPAERAAIQAPTWAAPHPLRGLEGWRVEVTRRDGTSARFIVGRSTGWQPCYLELKTRSSAGGMMADNEYRQVTKLYKAKP